MGIIADSIVSYAQPLLDETDGSHEQMNKALGLAQMCWNLAVLPEKDREKKDLRITEAPWVEQGRVRQFQTVDH